MSEKYPALNELLILDKAEDATWDTYTAFLEKDAAGPDAPFVDALVEDLLRDEQIPLACGHYRFTAWCVRWSAARKQQDFLRKLAFIIHNYHPDAHVFHFGRFAAEGEMLAPYLPPRPKHPQSSVPAIVNLRRRTLAAKRTADSLHDRHKKTVWLDKGTDAYEYTLFHNKREKWFSTSVEHFESTPAMLTAKERFETDRCQLADFFWREDGFESHDLQHFFVNKLMNQEGGNPTRDEIGALILAVATQRGGAFFWDMSVREEGGSRLVYSCQQVNACANRELSTLLFILKKCGRFEDVFALLPELPDDVPLLLMCFADPAIRERVEAYLGIPGLKAAYDIALSPKYCTLKEQVKLVEFGAANPSFQELLAKSLNRYCYYTYNTYKPAIDWYCLDYAHFARAWGADILCLLTSRAYLLEPAALMLRHGPQTYFSSTTMVSSGFKTVSEYIERCLTGYLALQGAAELEDWLPELRRWELRQPGMKKIKLYEFVDALRR